MTQHLERMAGAASRPRRRTMLARAGIAAGASVLLAGATAAQMRSKTVSETPEPPPATSAVAAIARRSAPLGAVPVPTGVSIVDTPPGLLRFPDVPGSACVERDDCVTLDRGPSAPAVTAACREAGDVKRSEPPHRFTLPISGMTAFCQASRLGVTCMASCTLRFTHIDAPTFQQRAEDVAQSLRNVHGVDLSRHPWRSVLRDGEFTSLQRQWSWASASWRLTVKAQWRPWPETSDAPSDVHLDFAVPIGTADG